MVSSAPRRLALGRRCRDIDAVSVVVANHLHREVIEALLATGKHVLCEKPLAPSVADARSMVEAASDTTGLPHSALPLVTRDQCHRLNSTRATLANRCISTVRLYGYPFDPQVPMTWRYRGGPGSGVLADVGSHIVDTAEMLCGPIVEVGGGSFVTGITDAAVPAGATMGHGRVETTGETEVVDNEDVAVFTHASKWGSRLVLGVADRPRLSPTGLASRCSLHRGFGDIRCTTDEEFHISDGSPREHLNGRRRVYVGPEHPYIAQGIPMDALGVGHGLADRSSSRREPSSTNRRQPVRLPRCPASTVCTACRYRSGHHLGHQWWCHCADSDQPSKGLLMKLAGSDVRWGLMATGQIAALMAESARPRRFVAVASRSGSEPELSPKTHRAQPW